MKKAQNKSDLTREGLTAELLSGILNINYKNRDVYRKALTEFLINGKTLDETAKILQLSRTRVNVILHDGVKLFKKDFLKMEERVLELENLLNDILEQLMELNVKYETLKKKHEINNELPPEVLQKLKAHTSDIPFSARLKSILESGRLFTIGDVINESKTNLYKLRNCGKKSVEEFEAYMAKNGLNWNMRT